jgi:hypothetical protein
MAGRPRTITLKRRWTDQKKAIQATTSMTIITQVVMKLTSV